MFESIPDVWAIDQVFPIVPIERPDETPDRRGIIADMTCDSDGMVETYVENEAGQLAAAAQDEAGRELPHRFLHGRRLPGNLGDIHNLFGDTDAVEVLADADGYAITQQRRGDTTDVMLDYVGYRRMSCVRPMRSAWPRRSCRRNARRSCRRHWKPA